jgi:hypothetical protein
MSGLTKGFEDGAVRFSDFIRGDYEAKDKVYMAVMDEMERERLRVMDSAGLAIDAALLEAERERVRVLRRHLDNIKIRSYELGKKELHDMALAALQATADQEGE